MSPILGSKYLNPVAYTRAAARRLNHHVFDKLDLLFAPHFDSQFEHPPIFIIGPPRSGSTLIIQVLTDALDVAYMSNFHDFLFGHPALAEFILKPLGRKSVSNYTSSHGKTMGWREPAESGEFWYRFFRRNPAYVPLDDADEAKLEGFRRSILALTRAAGRPVLFKNLYTTLRLEPLRHYLPEALFIWVRRDEFDNAISLLAARKKSNGNFAEWFSMEPPGVDEIKCLAPGGQVVEQIRSAHTLIEREIQIGRLDRNRILTISYEKFCADVNSEIDRVQDFLVRHGEHIARFYNVPPNFKRKTSPELDSQMLQQVRNYIDRPPHRE